MKRCPECGEKIDYYAETCPNCGAVFASDNQNYFYDPYDIRD